MSSHATPQRRKQRVFPALLAIAITVNAGLGFAGVARAGEWAVISCSQPDGQPAPSEGWVAAGAGDNKESLNTCDTPGGALIAQVGDQVEQPAYQPATWTFTAPPGSTIAGGTLTLGLYTPEGQAYAETPANSYDSADVIGNCQYNTGNCASQWNLQIDSIAASQTGGTQLFLGAECVAPVQGHSYCQQPGDPQLAANGLDAQLDLYRAIIDLQNDATPTASGFSGGLLSPGTSGTQDLLFTASDPGGPGVRFVTVTIDGRAVYSQTPDSNGGACQSIGTDPTGAPEYLSTQPCRTSETVTVPVDTTTLASGSHHLIVTVTDAAGNTSPVYDSTITVSNPSPGAGRAGETAGWRVSLTIRPGHVHRGTTITLAGLVKTSPRPRLGKLIYLQARSVTVQSRRVGGHERHIWRHGAWITFAVLRTGPDGRFTTTYTFRLGGPHRYQMRAVAPAEGGFSFRSGSSPPVLINET